MGMALPELTIDSHASIHADGPVTLELPEYMVLLTPEELAEARVAPDRAKLVLAAGRHPNGNILFVTGVGSIMEIDCKEYDIPGGLVRPTDYGSTIRVEAPDGCFMFAAGRAIELGTMILSARIQKRHVSTT